jgi:DNA-binding HxlR family transcriptional regulator/DNA gyrase inhibitor GyrI
MLFMNNADENFTWKTLTNYYEDIAPVLSALGNRRRLFILAHLIEKPRTFNELQRITRLGKTALAHHLGILVASGVLKRTRRGHYRISADGTALLNPITSAYANSKRKRSIEASRRADYIQRIYTKQKESDLKEFHVRIEKLKPMRVASARAISKTPERDAWTKMRTWAEPRGLLEDLEKHPVFGFNSPDPTPDRQEYGYEFWIRVEPEIKVEGEVEPKEFQGGLYAVTTCNLKEEIESEFFQKEGYLESWKKIVDWVKASEYSPGKHQCLEKAHDPGATDEELVLDLYCPIEK